MHGLPRPRAAVSRFLMPAIVLAVFAWSLPAQASSWPITVSPVSHAQAQARPAPPAPASASSVCGTGLLSGDVVVTWAAVANATTYTVYQSTSAASGPYTPVATGVTATTWTSGALGTGSYWYEVSATVGSNWVGANSSATAQRTVVVGLLCL